QRASRRPSAAGGRAGLPDRSTGSRRSAAPGAPAPRGLRGRAGPAAGASELACQVGGRDLVDGRLAELEPLELGGRERARVAWIRDIFSDGVPGDPVQIRALVGTAARAG